MRVAAIIPAAGAGTRLKSRTEKPYIKIGNKPILSRTLLALSKNKDIKEILVSVGKSKLDKARKEIIQKYNIKKARLVIGGKERGDSVFNALKAVSKDMDYVLIHDGIRPFVTDGLIRGLLREASRHGAAIAAVPVKPTLKLVGENGFIKGTPPREYYWEAQTPQVFKRDMIDRAYRIARRKKIKATDDSMLVERLGVKPKIVLGSYSNIKITTKEDLELAKIILKKNM
ncbi:MAG: 2-C-methyl-D-erythritol 4-phosphate cytidylyltransferase [Candidatus Omnitrophota bacterium]|nr:2-C-methyl-D-erythritol 4-phosphate cytidylyltransferase [Candidatus Omnitrophota bacterium]